MVHWVFRSITGGYHMHVRVSGKGAEVSIGPRDAPPIVIECRGRVERLAPGRMIRLLDGVSRLPDWQLAEPRSTDESWVGGVDVRRYLLNWEDWCSPRQPRG